MDNTEIITTKTGVRTIDMAYIALGAALIAVCSWISIPTAVPFTLQTFAVFALLSLLGGKRGTLAILVYILLGAVGAPVFAGFSGGVGVLLGTTGGYILGFIITGLIYWAVTSFTKHSLVIEIITLVVGLAACYAVGTFWFMEVYSKSNGSIGAMTALGWCVFPFIIPDLIKLALALGLARRVRPVIK
ncbi:biotin transport system substrate-specific component [Pseudobutyrivibrio sp. YE44]|uniref:biotin transporter BioY n=1 Tax=Pseudobutyrivibrio sp. YE44 TaxID=1520802 RepID=UPI000888F3A9|nr:biotin transporter BioY [Pseudobutyrivibrio sp. YE44]SDB21370.1 biotin transport system substrate-specific component [Pseudobutyrivibrio sp. YE44]